MKKRPVAGKKAGDSNVIIAALARFFPEKSDDQRWDVLMNYTCYPFGSAKDILPQIRQHARAVELGRPQCDLCGTMSPRKDLLAGHGACRRCRRALRAAANKVTVPVTPDARRRK